MTGAELRALREKTLNRKGTPLTQVEAAMRLGIARNHYACCERGIKTVTRTVAKLAKYVLRTNAKLLDPDDP